MNYLLKLKLTAVYQLCMAKEKSVAYSIQLMQDVCKCSLDVVTYYLSINDTEKQKLFDDINQLSEVISQLENLN